MDISCTEIEICGYVDIEMNTVGGDEDFKQTRILIVAGTATNVILGRTDMKLLKMLGENFPLPVFPAWADSQLSVLHLQT